MLLTNGCSFVWGDELLGYEKNKHHHLTFSHKLSRKMGIPYINLATCGSCNSKIFRDTLNELRSTKNKITHMVIIWSAWSREEVAEPNISEEKNRKIQRFQCMTQISPSRLSTLEPDLAKGLGAFYDVYDPVNTGILNGLSYMRHMEWICGLLDIKLIQGVFHIQSWDTIRTSMDPRKLEWKPWQDYVRNIIEELEDTSRLGMNREEDMYSMAVRLDDLKEHGHPGEKTHAEYAEILYKLFMDEENWS